MSSDSGVWTGGEGPDGSPRSRRRPRNLEMVMRGTHSFHLRELQVADLDIMGQFFSIFRLNNKQSFTRISFQIVLSLLLVNDLYFDLISRSIFYVYLIG